MSAFLDRSNEARIGTISLIIGLQIAVTCVSGVIVWIASKKMDNAFSALWGGSIGFLSALTYARVVQAARGQGPNELVKAHYLAQALKFSVTIVLFAVTFALADRISPLPLFLTYIATLFAYWAGLLLHQDDR